MVGEGKTNQTASSFDLPDNGKAKSQFHYLWCFMKCSDPFFSFFSFSFNLYIQVTEKQLPWASWALITIHRHCCPQQVLCNTSYFNLRGRNLSLIISHLPGLKWSQYSYFCYSSPVFSDKQSNVLCHSYELTFWPVSNRFLGRHCWHLD